MLQGSHEQWIESEKKDRELVEQEHDTAEQEGGEDFEAKPVGNKGEVHEGSNGVGQEEDEFREIVEDTAQDLEEKNEEVTEENVAVDELQKARETPDEQLKESRSASANDQVNEIENEAMPMQDGVDERTDTKAVNESRRDAMADSTDGLGSDEDEAAINNADGGSNASSPETYIDRRAPGDKVGAGRDLSQAEKVHVEEIESNANDDAKDEDSTQTSDEFEHQDNKADVVNDPDDQNSIETDLKESISTVDGGEPMRNDSSIAAVSHGVARRLSASHA